MTSKLTRISNLIALLLGAAMAANGLAMLGDPQAWYARVPGVIATGAFNQHFIRDIGLIYLLIGLAFAAGAFRSALRLTLWAAATLWLAGHALFHLWEVAAGICGSDAIPRDFPGVTLPALIGIGLTILSWRETRLRNPERR
ncbi:hypothetical protein [Sphingomonas sp.]|uniref:hypothetical protein n=1 Tax=Sphingomonas sp. TaxID=28214 RepID=UPI002DBF972E|nr:hypothetical protein [Sphingomonas sp.]HEU4968549.1 hypothetical protein [Sphingomonas sp.]